MSPTTELLIKAVIKSLKNDKFNVDAWTREIEFEGDREEFLLVATKSSHRKRRRNPREIQIYARQEAQHDD